MAGPPSRDQQTRELIQRFQAKRDRRRRLGWILGTFIGVAIAALVIAVVLLTMHGSGEQDIATGPTDNTSAATAAGATQPDSGQAPQGSISSVPAGSVTSSTEDISAATTSPTTLASTTTTTHETTTSTAPSTTTSTVPATTTTSAAPTAAASAAAGLVVVIDPGHQRRGNFDTEPIGPGSSERKAKVSSGTAGVATGVPESELVLAVSLKLRDALAAHGVQVVMTRTTQDIDISNVERAQMANEAGADLFVRIHADGSDNHAVAGIHVLYPASVQGWTDDIAAESKTAAAAAQRELIAATGAKDRGIDARSDMTGFNWSDVPVILPEIGFMTNPEEDRLLATSAYQDKIVQGLTRAILSYLGAG